MKKLKPLSKKELGELFSKVDSEGFGYYMIDYGPDLEALERLGFNKSEVEKAIKLMSEIQDKIMEGEEYAEDF